MTSKSKRDPQNLTREDLLDDYVSRAKNRRGALTAATLSMNSVSMRDIFVHAALGTNTTSEELKRSLLSGQQIYDEVKDAAALAELGSIVLLQNLLDGDSQYGQELLKIAEELSQDGLLSLQHSRVLLEQAITDGSKPVAQELLDRYPALQKEFFGYLGAELKNPYTLGSRHTTDEWMSSFNEVFTAHGLEPLNIIEDDSVSPFDRLTSLVNPNLGLRPNVDHLISIIMTTHRPSVNNLLTSVRSILAQTWTNFELIIVDDGSGESYDREFEHIQSLDARVAVIRLQENRGVYSARNRGYDAAHGDFLTVQSDAEWSHPRRLQRQVEFLQRNPSLIGCRINGIQVDENLGRVRVGHEPETVNESALMIRREGYDLAGQFLEMHRAGDSEYCERVAQVSGRLVGHVDEPLSVIRIAPYSSSYTDFAPGWTHSARKSFYSSYKYWHRTAALDELTIGPRSTPPVKIPRRFQSQESRNSTTELDVIFAGDWLQNGGPQKSMLEEIYALKEQNYRLGVMNLSAAWFMSKDSPNRLNEHVQKLINEGIVDEIHYDDPVSVRLLIVRYPPILQFLSQEKSKIEADRLIILANQAPSESDGSSIRYLVHECHFNAYEAFGVTPVWVPQGPQVRKALEGNLKESALAKFDMPGILNINEWWHKRLWYRSTVPVVGRHSRDHVMKWPSDRSETELVYPVDGRYDVRFMGGASVPMRVLGVQNPPPGWTIYDVNELPVRSFLQSLDYFVFYPNPVGIEAFGRAILEAIASGTVTILPLRFKEVFGDAAIYSRPEDVHGIIEALHSDYGAYQSQQRRAYATVRKHFSYEFYQELISTILVDD